MNHIILVTDSNWVNAMEIATNPAWVQPTQGESYVWGESDPNGPAAVISRTFLIKSLRKLKSASLFLVVDNYAIVLINGVPLIIDAPQDTLAFYNPGRTFDISLYLHEGLNNIVIAGFNSPSNANRTVGNPAGILARLEVHFEHHHGLEQEQEQE